jgi:hypothetical protein
MRKGESSFRIFLAGNPKKIKKGVDKRQKRWYINGALAGQAQNRARPRLFSKNF